jgi:hypothetical protein
MALSTGSTVLNSDMAALFTRLEAIRVAHNKRSDMSDITTAISTPTAVGKTVKSSDVQSAKNAATTLENGIPNMSGFASQISVPSVGSLLKASTLTALGTVITGMESVCANNSVNGFNGHDGNEDNNGANNGFSCPHSFGNNTSNCSWF